MAKTGSAARVAALFSPASKHRLSLIQVDGTTTLPIALKPSQHQHRDDDVLQLHHAAAGSSVQALEAGPFGPSLLAGQEGRLNSGNFS